MSHDVDLRRRFLGAPDSLRHAMRERAEDPELPRATRREWSRALAELEPRPAGVGVMPFVVADLCGADGAILYAIASDGSRSDLFTAPRDCESRVMAWLRATWPAIYVGDLRLHVSAPAGERWAGRSCEVALAIAALSHALSLAPDPQVVVTGLVDTPGLTAVATHVDEKRRVVARDRPGDRLIATASAPIDGLLDTLVPGASNRLRSLPARHAPSDARRALAALFSADHVRAGTWAQQALATADLDAASRARARWVEGALALHAGRMVDGLASLQAARADLPGWVDTSHDPAEDLTAEELDAWLIVALTDNGRPHAAQQLSTDVLARLESAGHRSRRWRHVATQVAGSAHRAAITAGDLNSARDLLCTWSLGRATLIDQQARALGDLAEVERRADRPVIARERLTQAHELLVDAGDDGPRTRLFLDLFDARLRADAGERIDPPGVDIAPWPALGFRLLRTRTAHEDLATIHSEPLVRSSAPLRTVVDAEIAWHVLHDGPGARLLTTLQASLRDTTTDDPDLARLHQRIATSPSTADLAELRRRAPYG